MSLGAKFDSIILGAKTGAPWALEALYRDLQPRLLRYLTSQAPSVAEDLASETWLGVATVVPRFEGDEEAFRAFVFSVGRRRLLDHRRKEARRNTTSVPQEYLESAGPVADVEQEAIESLGTGWAMDRISALPPDQAEVVLLRVVGDLSVEDVAAILGKRPGAIRSLQLRALRRLARDLATEPVTR